MKIAKKAYRVWIHSMIGEYPIFSIDQIDVVYADTVSEAKNHCELYGWKNEHGDDAKWIDIKCIRAKEEDKIEYGGEVMTRHRCAQKIEEEKRNERLRNLDENDMYYVQDSRSYVGNCVLWHGLNGAGYVCGIKEAHKFTKEEILKQFLNGRDTDIIWSAKHIEQHIKEVIDVQNISSKFCV